MKIEVTHIIKADDRLLSLVGAVLTALGNQTENLTVADDVQPTKETEVTENEASTKATKRTYLFHAEAGAVIVVNKGEELQAHFEQGLDEITKAEYDRIQTEKQARIDKAKAEYDKIQAEQPTDESKEETNETPESENHDITIEMVRAEAAKLTSKGRQADFKAILTSFEAPKLSSVPLEKYPDLLSAIKEAVAEGEA